MPTSRDNLDASHNRSITPKVNPNSATFANGLCSSVHRNNAALQRACDHIAASWRRLGLSPAEAAEQAENFRRRYESLQNSRGDAELDATLDRVAAAMAQP